MEDFTYTRSLQSPTNSHLQPHNQSYQISSIPPEAHNNSHHIFNNSYQMQNRYTDKSPTKLDTSYKAMDHSYQIRANSPENKKGDDIRIVDEMCQQNVSSRQQC